MQDSSFSMEFIQRDYAAAWATAVKNGFGNLSCGLDPGKIALD
jgi:hypothetical protein